VSHNRPALEETCHASSLIRLEIQRREKQILDLIREEEGGGGGGGGGGVEISVISAIGMQSRAACMNDSRPLPLWYRVTARQDKSGDGAMPS
jgi:hypothetical protein